MKKQLYRILEIGNGDSSEVWRGMAWNADHALERCYADHDEEIPTCYAVHVEVWRGDRWVNQD